MAPRIEETGYKRSDINVSAGIPPAINVAFFKEKDVEPERVEKLLSEHKDQTMLKLIVWGLQKADGLQKELKLDHYKFSGLTMKLGLPPDITLRFSRN